MTNNNGETMDTYTIIDRSPRLEPQDAHGVPVDRLSMEVLMDSPVMLERADGFHSDLVGVFTKEVERRWARECVARVLPLYESQYPGDLRVRAEVESEQFQGHAGRIQAMSAAWEAWLAVREHPVESIRQYARDFTRVTVAGGCTMVPPAEDQIAAGRAAMVAEAAVHIWGSGHRAAKMASRAASDVEAERRWQGQRLIEIMREHGDA